LTTLSIVIVNWNHRELLLDLLTSIFEHPPRGDFEVIVVDNASTDGSRETATAEFTNIKLLANAANLGFARAVNRGLRESGGQYVLLLNTDVVVLEGAIDAQIAFMESNPGCAICGGLLLNDNGDQTISYGRFPSARALMAEVLPNRMGIAARNMIACTPAADQTQVLPVDVMSGADLMVRRAVFEKVGLLDEQFFMYFEDADWCYRMKQDGWDVSCVPTVHYTHHETKSAISWSSHRDQWLTSLGQYLRKHYRGVQFVTCWLIWQLLRAKFVLRKVRMRVETVSA
jgi:N-acetylglucosaminyl-diphospho-decaprenol L-rhamnosyltransferase